MSAQIDKITITSTFSAYPENFVGYAKIKEFQLEDPSAYEEQTASTLMEKIESQVQDLMKISRSDISELLSFLLLLYYENSYDTRIMNYPFSIGDSS